VFKMSVKIIFSDEFLLNIESVPKGWLWVDLADALVDIGGITQTQYTEIYGHEDANNLAIGTFQLMKKNSSRQPEVNDKDIPAEKEFSSSLKNDSAFHIPQPTQITPSAPKAVTHQIYKMDVKCSKNNQSWEAILASEFKPIRNSSSHISHQASDSLRIHLILDDSGSMRKNNAMRELKNGVTLFLGMFNNAHVGIRWFNSTSLAIRPIGTEHEYILNNGIAKHGNDHAQSLVDLLDGKGASRVISGDVVIMFTDGKPNGKGKNVIEAAKKVKQTGARIITIGCGDSESEFMEIISSPNDHHQIDKVTDIAKTFTTVGRSLAQVSSTSNTFSKSSIAPAKQIQHRIFKPERVNSTISPLPKLNSEEGFDHIEDFQCFFCHDKLRVICSQCSETHCGGGLKTSSKRKLGGVSSKQLQCSNCGTTTDIEMSDIVFGSASQSTSKKGR